MLISFKELNNKLIKIKNTKCVQAYRSAQSVATATLRAVVRDQEAMGSNPVTPTKKRRLPLW